MDAISNDNRARWNALARANVEYSQPFLDFTIEQAAEYILVKDKIRHLIPKYF